MERGCWGNFQCRGILLVWMIVGQGPVALAAVRVVWTFILSSVFSLLSPSLWETTRYRLKYCLKGPLNPKQPTNQLSVFFTKKGLQESIWSADQITGVYKRLSTLIHTVAHDTHFSENR